MGINFKKRILVQEAVLMACENCHKVYSAENLFCPTCGTKLTPQKTKVYANFGKTGLMSFSYKLPNGITFNSKGKITFPIINGISYTTTPKKPKNN